VNEQLIKVEKMLAALLRSGNQLHWVGGFVYGRTDNDDPFIILYPAAGHMKQKVCRVYEHDFKKLPAFVPTGHVPADTNANPPKEQARKAGIYHECQLFQIVTFHGKETQMGREVRFSDVLRVSQNGSGQAQRPAGEPPPEPIRQDPRGKTNPAAQAVRKAEQNGSGLTAAEWKARAAEAREDFDFFTCIAKAWPGFYVEGGRVESTFDVLFPRPYDPRRNGAYLAGMAIYADVRANLEASGTAAGPAHATAKARAIKAYQGIVAPA